jgi:hypothetical protein
MDGTLFAAFKTPKTYFYWGEPAKLDDSSLDAAFGGGGNALDARMEVSAFYDVECRANPRCIRATSAAWGASNLGPAGASAIYSVRLLDSFQAERSTYQERR